MGKHEKKGERVVLRRDGHQGTHTHTQYRGWHWMDNWL